MMSAGVPGRCPACGAAHSACGPVGTGTPVDVDTAPVREVNTMDGLREYQYVGPTGQMTTAMLSELDALRLGAEPVPSDARGAERKARDVPNMARSAVQNKGR